MTRLYLISPPAIDLPVFSNQLEAVFSGGIISPPPPSSGGGSRWGSAKNSGLSLAVDPHPASLFQGEENKNCVGSFQLRLKGASDAEIIEAAKALIPICHAHEAAFILNDRPDLAAQCNADGVHLGQDDLSALSLGERGGASRGEGYTTKEKPSPYPLPEGEGIKRAREIVGSDRIIGVSCHDSRHLAMEAGEHGADYVAFGAFYPTTSKSPEALARYGTPTPDILEWWQTYMVLPCVAIGGITPGNCAPLVRAGADFIAVITAVWSHPDGPKKAVSILRDAIAAAQDQ